MAMNVPSGLVSVRSGWVMAFSICDSGRVMPTCFNRVSFSVACLVYRKTIVFSIQRESALDKGRGGWDNDGEFEISPDKVF